MCDILLWEEKTDGNFLISTLNLFLLYGEVSWKFIVFKIRCIMPQISPRSDNVYSKKSSQFSPIHINLHLLCISKSRLLYLCSVMHFPWSIILESSTLFVLDFLQVHYDLILFLEFHRLNLLLQRYHSWNYLWQYKVKSLLCPHTKLGRKWEGPGPASPGAPFPLQPRWLLAELHQKVSTQTGGLCWEPLIVAKKKKNGQSWPSRLPCIWIVYRRLEPRAVDN